MLCNNSRSLDYTCTRSLKRLLFLQRLNSIVLSMENVIC
uniref:Uncharacterized protein n=1 Tax=Anguilla anguilla TaxID=7936 RepID=A0A0E9WZZ0_ANGAN